MYSSLNRTDYVAYSKHVSSSTVNREDIFIKYVINLIIMHLTVDVDTILPS